MLRYSALTLLSVLSFSMLAETADSLSSRTLDEIVVQAPKVVRKADMDLYYPSQSTVEHSKDAVQMLRNMLIPSLTVNEALGTITSAGEGVQLRINGRQASVDQVKALLPESVKRVEWIDNPGLRYNGASAVLNLIVANPEVGGSLMTQAMPALNTAWGPFNASLKLNNGRSQWGLSANFKLTNRIGMYREYEEKFTFANGNSVTRTETPLDGYMSNTFGSLQADYSYIKPDTTVIWVAVTGQKDWNDGILYHGIMHSGAGSEALDLRDFSTKSGVTPGLSAYVEQHFVHNQILAVDFSASLYSGKSRRSYVETPLGADKPVTDVYTSIRDRNQAYGIQANYIKNWKKSRLTAGVSYSANRNRSVYENLGNKVFHQQQDRVYFFGEYFQRIRKVTLTAGMGAQYTTFLFLESGQGSSSWNIRPQFTATYRLNDASQFRLGFSSWQSTPSLAETNVAPQQTDGFQWRVGNPKLKTSSSYMLTLRYNFTFPKLMGSCGVRAFSSPNAITPFMQWHDDKLVTSYENSRGLQNLTFFLSPQIEVLPGWLNLSGTVRYRAERMRGTGYKHYNHSWSGDVTAMLQHWNFTLIAQYVRGETRLWGETISWDESISMLALAYDWRKWEFTVGAICPFTKYDRGSQSLGRYNSSINHIRLSMAPLPFVQVRYNIQWGRQKRGAQKLVNADASVESSTTGSR